ncbi:GTP-binding protein RHO1 [Astathelohania contejeani]|uniref:GTP-binding protein RHO1 n=1 Tax=Astathelohania contejeani TaxID=164912 RepID=A0ABQ7HV98_9MICR|nr:GTP-binding protein RHO1 [Thelohania contejeani]
MKKDVIRKKITIIGDGASGKTSMLLRFCKDTFSPDYTPTVFENSFRNIEYKNCIIELWLWDTAGQEDYDRIMALSYPDTDVLLICFAVCDLKSFESVTRRWVPEAKHRCAGTPMILVGCKSDLREDPETVRVLEENNQKMVSTVEGTNLANEIGALAYYEVSSKTGDNIQPLFDFIAEYIHQNKNKQKKKKGFFKKLFGKCFGGK